VEQTSTQQRQLIDIAVKSKLILDSIDAYLFEQPSLVNHRRRCVLPVVTQRQSIADGLARYMTQLGLEKKAKLLHSLSEYLSQGKAASPPTTNTNKTKVTHDGVSPSLSDEASVQKATELPNG